MRILFIATGFAPYTFSENIVNSKLVMAFLAKGWEVDVISKKDEGATYTTHLEEEWGVLKPLIHELSYPVGGPLVRWWDTIACLSSRTAPA